MDGLIQTRDLGKEFRRTGFTVKALTGINLTVEEGEFVALMGP